MRPSERPYITDHQAVPDQTLRQFKHPLHIQPVALRADERNQTKPIVPASQPLYETDFYEQHSPSYEELEENLPANFFSVTSMNNMRLMQISGAMRAVRLIPYSAEPTTGQLSPATEWWVGRAYHSELSAQTSPALQPVPISESLPPLIQLSFDTMSTDATILSLPQAETATKKRAFWLGSGGRTIITLLIGIALLALVVRFVNMPITLHILRYNLATPRGLFFASMAGLSLICSYCIRGARWRLFLQPIGKVSLLCAIQLFWVAMFINFILPVQGGELAKSLMLKRICNIPISKSLPTIAMDKTLDLLPALFIMALVPFIPGIHMSPMLWTILGLVSSILVGLIVTVGLMAMSRRIAGRVIHAGLRFLPQKLASKIEDFAFGFIDALLAGMSRPRIFFPAILLTLLAVGCDGLFALFSFWTVGVTSMTFWIAIFGYAVYTMFYILPTPPGHVGSNEFAGFIVFSELLGYKQNEVTAMFIFSHPLGAVIMGIACMLCLSGLGLSFSNAISLKQHEAGSKM
jgi:uncharacterized protein (TIRG00374 family)